MIVQQSMSSVAAVYDRRLEKAGIRAAGEVARRICPAQAGRSPQGRASGNEQVSAGMRPSHSPAKPIIENHNVVPSFSPEGWRTLAGGNTPGNDSETLRPEGSPESIVGHPIRPISPIRPIPPHLEVSARPTWSALTENHNVVPSFNPGLAAQRPTPGKAHKIQPLMAKPREARIKIAANFPKIQPCFPHPPTHPHSKSTLAIPKSTVDLGCERLIWGENGFRSFLSHGHRHPFRPTTTRQSKGTDQIQTATHQKIYSASPLIQVKTPALEFAWRLPRTLSGLELLPGWPSARTQNHKHLFIMIFPFKAFQAYSREFKPIQAFLPASFFYFYAPISKNPTPATTTLLRTGGSIGTSLVLGGWLLELLPCWPSVRTLNKPPCSGDIQ
jgi:hypothetical protein